ncbi:MAG: cation-translocating P-type ATPase [Oscillospiraceae bacterium]|nr:cation-translocating P-type ATPase [Oscillospiraceae bacterium]
MWHSMSERELLQKTESSLSGLTSKEAVNRLARDGENAIAQSTKKTPLGIFLAQFNDLMIWVLIAAAAVSAVIAHEMIDTVIILAVVLLNAVLGAIQEARAEAALDALKKLTRPSAKVLRNGSPERISAKELVIGDIVLLEAGDAVPADIRLIESCSLKIEESALTGESVPVEKTAELLGKETLPLGDRINMAFMGTAATYGRGRGVVAATGMDTQMGAIAHALDKTKKDLTPLQKTLTNISRTISIGVLAVAGIVFALNIISGMGSGAVQSFMLAVSLAVAAIPEGMVAVVTIVLAMGMSRMAGRNAIIRRLPAVETLGSTHVICSDKTGTLTQNRMTVSQIWSNDEKLLFRAMGHNNDSRFDSNGKLTGDPTETALIEYLLKNKKWTHKEIKERRREGEIPFDSERKLSSVAVKLPDGGMCIFVKGAPDVLLSKCRISPAESAIAEGKNEEMAGNALRVLAFAYKTIYHGQLTLGNWEKELTFIGLAGMIDPPRVEAKKAIALCRNAGITPVMITGDHKITAVAIAREIGILGQKRANRAVTGAELDAMSDAELERGIEKIGVYARVSPHHKSRIISAWQNLGKVVSMTGDGVNDAPALRKADIGIAMGRSGTDVSRGASDIILTDDNFHTIVTAVKEGRRIFDNIHKTVKFLLSSNAGEVIAILAATLAGWTSYGHVFLAPVHILWINLVTDSFPALALGTEPAEKDIMKRRPRDRDKSFFSGKEWLMILGIGAVEASLTITAYLLGCAVSPQMGTTMAFLTLSLSQLFAALGFRSEHISIFQMSFRRSFMLPAFMGSGLLQLAVVIISPLRLAFGLQMPGWLQWMQIIALCLVMLLFIEAQKWSKDN